MEATITKHAYERAKERLKWNNETLDKMADLALKEGYSHSDTKGRLKKYITRIWFDYKKANNVKIYGEDVYLFAGTTLMTIFRLPHNLLNHIKRIK